MRQKPRNGGHAATALWLLPTPRRHSAGKSEGELARLQTELTRWSGVAPGLPHVRLMLVLIVVGFQSAEVSESWIAVMATPLWIAQALALPALFVATGFLLALSRRRHTAVMFIGRRARRIMPTVFMVIAGSALLVGPLVTTSPLGSYFTDPALWAYFANLIAIPAYELPGVFEFNNVASVINTIVGIFPLYAVLLGTAAISPKNERMAAIVVGTLTTSAAAIAVTAQALDILPRDPRNIVRLALAGPGLSIMLSGWLGMLIYSLRARIKLNGAIAIVVVIALAVVSVVGNASWTARPAFWIAATPATAYLVVYIAMQPLPATRIALQAQRFGFAILLLAYPLQQLVIDRGPRNQNFAVNFGIVAAPLLVIATLWWWVAARKLDGPRRDAQLNVVAASLDKPRWRAKRALRSRLEAALVPLMLSAAIGVIAVTMLALLFLALSRES